MAIARNITKLTSCTMRGRIPVGALATTRVLTEADLERRLAAFDADDSGAMQHVIADDPHETFFVAFGALVAMPRPLTAAQLAI